MKHRLWLLAVGCWLLAAGSMAAKKQFTLVIDAGHGGHDAGAVGSLTKEKIINLNVALAFGRLVEQNCPDVKVIYTRKSDAFIPLHTRADIANRNKADLFISIHTNSLPKGRISRGLETYTLGMHRAADNLAVAKRENEVILYEKDYRQRYQGFDPNSSESYIMFEFMQDHNMAQSVELAKYVQRRTCAVAGRSDKGVKQAGFLVLRETSMPSCLIELGFISTPDEERYLNSSNGVNQLGRGIYQAFLDYKRKYDTAVSVDYKEPPQQQQEAVTEKESKKDKKRRQKEAEEQAAREQATREQAAREQATRDSLAKAQRQQPQESAPVAASGSPADTPASPVAASPTDAPAVPSAPSASAQSTAPRLSAPIFMVQILASGSKLPANSPHFKGLKGVNSYQEGGLYKFTIGASTDYNEISQLRKSVLAKFPQAFIIAFRNGEKMDVRQAIQEFKSKGK